MAEEFSIGQRVALEVQLLEVTPHALKALVTWGETAKGYVVLPPDAVRNPENIPLQAGQNIMAEGCVEHVVPHHNGVTGVTVAFGKGIDRRIVVPSGKLRLINGTEIFKERHL